MVNCAGWDSLMPFVQTDEASHVTGMTLSFAGD